MRNLLPPSSRQENNYEDGSSRLLQNVDTHLPNCIGCIPGDSSLHSHHNEKLESHTVSPYCIYPNVTDNGGKI
jgi:hypothetical protein